MYATLLERPVLILDGGLGTTLEEQHNVHFSSASTPLWSSHLLLSSPETLLEVQTDFVRAGADVLLTATYQASFDGFLKTNLRPPDASSLDAHIGYERATATDLMRSAITISRSAFVAAGRHGLVALSLGAYGAGMIPSQEYTGKYPEEMLRYNALVDFHLERIMCFASHEDTWNSVDIVAFETLPVLAEVEAVRQVMKELKSVGKRQLEFWISCVFPNEENKLPDGSSVSQLVEAVLSDTSKPGSRSGPRPYAIGFNCCKVYRLRSLIHEFENAAKKLGLKLPHLVMYPDGATDLVYDTFAQQWIPQKDPLANESTAVLQETPSSDAHIAPQNPSDGSQQRESSARDVTASIQPSRRAWHEEVCDMVAEVQKGGHWEGVLVGGCCKTTPRHISQLRRSIEVRN